MCFFFSFMPAMFWVTVGYFILFSATKTEGAVSKFGRILAILFFVIAAFFPLMGAYVTFSDLCPMEQIMQKLLADVPP